MFVCQVKEMENIIKCLLKMIKKNVSYNYNTYIKEIYDKTEIVVKNYFSILNKAKYFLEDNQKTLDELIEFLENERVDFRTVRCEIRAIVSNDPFYLKNDDYASFMRGVLGVLQGGLESKILTDRGIENVFHNHTLNDIIEERKGMRVYENNKVELCTRITDAINEQEDELSIAWELVCESYAKISGYLINKLN